MTERRSRVRRQKLLGIMPAMLVYLAVMAAGPWLHLRAHDPSISSIQSESTPLDESAGVADVCELCRVLSGHELPFGIATRSHLASDTELLSETPAADPRLPAAAGRPRAPPASTTIA